MSIIADIIKMLWKFLTYLIQGEGQLVNKLADLITRHPKFFAVYVEISFVLLLFMEHMLRKRKEQRDLPVDPPKITVAPVTPPPCPPDTTLKDTIIKFVVIMAIVLLVLSRS